MVGVTTYSSVYNRNVLLVITVILLPDKLKLFNCKYLFWLLSLMANSKLLAAFIVWILGDASSIWKKLKWEFQKKHKKSRQLSYSIPITLFKFNIVSWLWLRSSSTICLHCDKMSPLNSDNALYEIFKRSNETVDLNNSVYEVIKQIILHPITREIHKFKRKKKHKFKRKTQNPQFKNSIVQDRDCTWR